ncbi:glycosyltransferase family 4 protein [Sphingomonas desiccabilis]|uniref:Glycosyltransferase family 1 protein n=1 Tax=Sphingomonas desiccabilis TaxID=429134 RepID=A0A4Q2IZ47_9SPHN|nr:glycosyltransferase family 1 protein [Sphingomonas desiccabilis]MBB3910053.1 glycosyltransferase involved in cell wall biosynthesis [Sphingomonas desiccabilis]RXZ34748.1 glycosyltransferase family 1 protein [Sphingomonas desiccabilis]
MQPSDLRVALFSGNYNYVRDGANHALNLLAGHLLAHGVTLRVYSPTAATAAFEPTGELVSVPSVGLPGGRGEYRLGLGLPASIRRDLARFRPNIVHVSAPDVLGHRAVSWARRHEIACLASLHTRFETYAGYYGMGFLEPIFTTLSRRFYNRADQVMVPTPSIEALIRSWGVRTPIELWGRGVDHDRFHPGARSPEWRRALGIADDEVAIGFLGRLVLEKGLDIFADVVALLRERGVRHKVLVIGEGPAREWFAERVPDAAFAGFQRGDALGRAVASMDVLFNPSVTETWGQVTSEAMAAGVPVVAARATGAVDLIDDGVTGVLVPPRDVTAYANAFQRIIHDADLRSAMGAAGRAKAQRYRWDTANQAVLDAYLRMLERRGR